MVQVVLFGRLQDAAGWKTKTVDAASLAEVRAVLVTCDASLDTVLNGPGVMAVVNHQLVRSDVALDQGDEVAFIPPVSGG